MEQGGRLVGLLVFPAGEFAQSKKEGIVKEEQVQGGDY